MQPSASFVPTASLAASESAIRGTLPRECTFSESDWHVLSRFWYPVAFSHEVTSQPYAARLLDERVVVYRLSDGSLAAAKDICYHRGAPLSLGHIEGNEIVCAYHGLRYNAEGRCTCIPAHPKGAISPRLRLHMFPVQEAYGLVWVRLVEDGDASLPEIPSLPEMKEWLDPGYIQILPDSISMKASAGRQVEGFLDVSHFSFVHKESFGEAGNAEVPDYTITKTPGGFVADYFSTVSNYFHLYKHLNPPGFIWHRRFEVFLPFTAKLTVFFPEGGQLHIMNAISPVSARKIRLFVPICRNFDKDAPLQETLDFNRQIFTEDQAIVEQQYPEDLPLDLHAEAHFPADRSSIAYRKGLAVLGLGRTFTA
jgi:phenylpropionate dioxygenase-like ring-hydroxylating dioxygenase large terminal subunit